MAHVARLAAQRTRTAHFIRALAARRTRAWHGERHHNHLQR
jgi:hypothetical protein